MARHEPEINSLTVACVVAETEEVLDNVHVDRILMHCCSWISAVLRVWLVAEKRWIIGVMGAFPTTNLCVAQYCKKRKKKNHIISSARYRLGVEESAVCSVTAWSDLSIGCHCSLQRPHQNNKVRICKVLTTPNPIWSLANTGGNSRATK